MALTVGKRGSPLARRNLMVGLAFAAPTAIIIGALVSVVRARAGRALVAAERGGPGVALNTTRVVAPSTVRFPAPDGDDDEDPGVDLKALAGLDVNDDASGEARPDDAPPLDDDGALEEPDNDKHPPPPRHFGTVDEATAGSCSTTSIEGLSRQIIEEERCLTPTALVPVPSRPNLVTGPYVFPYLQVGARDHLLRVLDAHKNVTMKLNSALRTVAQQYMVWRWSATKSCGVVLATTPGDSNHELGLALDVADHATWRSALEAEQFRWLGASDRVHFDYRPGVAALGEDGKPGRKMADVLAFERLWNRNHPSDRVPEDGRYGPAVEKRLKEAPPDGFPIGAHCSKAGGGHAEAKSHASSNGAKRAR